MVAYSMRNGVAVVTFDEPERRNALGADDMTSFTERLHAWANNPEVRALVVRGDGPAFSAGADFGLLRDLSAEGGDKEALLWPGIALVRRLVTFPVPTVAAVHGPAYGGAASIALACDAVVASSDLRMGFVFTRMGLPGGDMLTTWLLARRVGTRRAFRLLADAAIVGAASAERLGIVDEVVADAAQAHERASEVAASWAEGPVNALCQTKAEILHLEVGRSTFDEQAVFELAEMVRAVDRTEFRLALAAHLDGVEPDLSGVPREAER